MEIPVDIIDVEAIEKRLNTLEWNFESIKNEPKGADEVIKVFELTIGYTKAIINDTSKYAKYYRNYAKKLDNIISLDSYSAGDNIYIDSCIRAVDYIDQIMKG